jgi:hypothetical protein
MSASSIARLIRDSQVRIQSSYGSLAVSTKTFVDSVLKRRPARTSGFVVGLAAGSASGVLSAAYPALVAARADPALAIRS